MQAELAIVGGKPVILELRDGVVYIDGEAQPIKNLTEEEVKQFRDDLESVTAADEESARALADAIRAPFIMNLIGKAAGDECVDKLSDLLDRVHYGVLKYLGETEE